MKKIILLFILGVFLQLTPEQAISATFESEVLSASRTGKYIFIECVDKLKKRQKVALKINGKNAEVGVFLKETGKGCQFKIIRKKGKQKIKKGDEIVVVYKLKRKKPEPEEEMETEEERDEPVARGSSGGGFSKNLGIHFDLSFSAAYVYTPTGESASLPILGQFAGGGTAGVRISKLILGLTSDYRYVNQYSSVDSAVGNRRGWRWNLVSPTIGAYFGKSVMVKADFQFLGNYKLLNKNEQNGDVSYSSPLGGRLLFMFTLVDHVYLGLFGEYTQFSSMTLDDTKHDSIKTSYYMLTSGLMLSLVL